MTVRRRCSARERRLDRDVRALRIENDLLAATVLLDKGADIYQLMPDRRYDWPIGERDGASTDLSIVPGQTLPRHLLAYFERFDAGWYGITNSTLGMGVGLIWPKEIFPYAWFWQELHASSGHPWYRLRATGWAGPALWRLHARAAAWLSPILAKPTAAPLSSRAKARARPPGTVCHTGQPPSPDTRKSADGSGREAGRSGRATADLRPRTGPRACR